MGKTLILTESQVKYIINELSPIGQLASAVRKFKKFESVEDAIIAIKEVPEIMKTFDTIFINASKIKNISELETLQAQLIHMLNPSGLAQNSQFASENTARLLNGYARLKGYQSWPQLKESVSGVKSTVSAGTSANTASSGLRDSLSGMRISNRSFEGGFGKNIDWTKITNAKDAATYNRLIANAIKTKNFEMISRGGFERYGIPNFREYLQNNIQQIIELDPNIGRWSVIFK